MSVIHQERENRLDARLLAPPILFAAALAGLFVRLWYLQVADAAALAERAEALRTREVEHLAPRGLIVDRRGRTLAGVRPEIVIYAVPAVVRDHPEALNRASVLLGVPAQRLSRQVRAGAWRPYFPTPVFVGASIQAATRIAEEPDRFPGLSVSSLPMRTYPDPATFAHVLGYVGTPSERDVRRLEEQGVRPAGFVGKLGIEFVRELDLMGVPAVERLEVDVRNRPVRSVGQDHATPGSRVVLSLDAELQRFAHQRLEGRRGAIVAIDPGSGEVLCLVSSPGYDASLFVGGISEEDFARLRDDPAQPLINRAIASAYAPGSVFKIVTAVASYLAGRDPGRKSVRCPGFFTIGRRRVRCLAAHGTVGFERAFAKSCNTFFATMAVQTGEERLREASRLMGLGERTGIDLLGERAGVVPTMEWIARWRNPPVWYGGDTVNFGIGQGEISVTPIQMAQVAALVANRGSALRPRLVRAVVPHGASTPAPAAGPETVASVDAGAGFWDLLHRSMFGVIDYGTGARAGLPGLRWGGKTGSAEHRRDAETHSWFVGFAPMERPRIAIAVLVENAGHGGEVAAPMAAEVVRRYLRGDGAQIQIAGSPKTVEASASTSEALSGSPSAR
jgi:penicillin-binding protein 2